MQVTRTLELSPGRLVTLRELRVGQMRHLLGLLTPERLNRALPDVLTDVLPELLGLASECLELPADTALDDLTCSEMERLAAAWWELHRAFFARVMAVLGLAIDASPTPAATSPAPASSSSASASSAPGTGVSATSSPPLS